MNIGDKVKFKKDTPFDNRTFEYFQHGENRITKETIRLNQIGEIISLTSHSLEINFEGAKANPYICNIEDLEKA